MATPSQYVLAGFADVDRMMDAARTIRQSAPGEVESYTPYPVHDLDEALGIEKSIMPTLIGASATAGVLGGYSLLWWVSTTAYPINVGGRPLHSWPAFIPITFECGVLASALMAFFGVLAVIGLPRLYHAVFESNHFRRASVDRFFLSVDITAKRDEAAQVEAKLRDLGAETVEVVTEDVEGR
jgi:hypothetical protein